MQFYPKTPVSSLHHQNNTYATLTTSDTDPSAAYKLWGHIPSPMAFTIFPTRYSTMPSAHLGLEQYLLVCFPSSSLCRMARWASFCSVMPTLSIVLPSRTSRIPYIKLHEKEELASEVTPRDPADWDSDIFKVESDLVNGASPYLLFLRLNAQVCVFNQINGDCDRIWPHCSRSLIQVR